MSKLLIHVGSTSEHKIGAVRAACEELCLHVEIVGFPAPSGVNEQPYGIEETAYGAGARALGAWNYGPHRPDLSIGIESGIVCLQKEEREGIKHQFVDMAVVVLRGPMGMTFPAMAAGHSVDPSDVEVARLRGFNQHTVSSITRERTGCSATDSTPHYTGGRVHRKECLQQAVKIALSQWLAWRERKAGDS